MAAWRDQPSPSAELRVQLAAEVEEFHRSLAERLGREFREPFVVTELRAGEPVEVHAWQLPGGADDHGFRADETVVVEPDGTVRPTDETNESANNNVVELWPRPTPTPDPPADPKETT